MNALARAALQMITPHPELAKKWLPASFSSAGDWPDEFGALENQAGPFRIGWGERVANGQTGAHRVKLDQNSAIYTCINTIATAFMEPPLEIWREAPAESVTGEWSKLRRHRMRDILRRPNRRYDDPDSPVLLSMKSMGWLNQWFKHVDGNAYWLKVRSGHPVDGRVVEYMPISPAQMRPRNTNDVHIANGRHDLVDPNLRSAVEWYELDTGIPGRDPIKVHPDNVIHFRLGVDPKDIRLGLGPVKFLAREVATDELAGKFTNNLLSNFAIPGLIITPAEGSLEEDEALQMKATFQREFANGNGGGTMVLSAGAKIEQFGYDPEKMMLAAIHKHCETRIAGVLNVPAIVAQLGAGIEQSSQFSNFHEAREMFAEDTMQPLWLCDGEVLTDQALPDFSTRDDEKVAYDLEKVSALQSDITMKFDRLQTAVKGGWMTANEARAAVGMPAIDLKEGQVPLTQGEDNRYNDLVAQGLVTLNEARESVGLPKVPGGDQLLSEFKARQGAANMQISQEGMRAAGIDPAQQLAPPGPNKPPGAPQGSLPGKPPGDDRDQSNRAGDAGKPENRRGANITNPDLRKKAWLGAVEVLTADELLALHKKAVAAGMSIIDLELEEA